MTDQRMEPATGQLRHSRFAGARPQNGVVLVMASVSLLALLGVTAMAVDGGHMLLNKTRLQNMVDASALSAAKTLDDSRDTVAARASAINTFTAIAADTGNKEISNAFAPASLVTEFSDTLVPFVPGGAAPRFVRVTANNANLQPWFMQALGFVTKQISASAVSGPSPALSHVCDIVPLVACGDPANPAGTFFGYQEGGVQVMKIAAGDTSQIGNGNFHLLNLEGSNGGNDVRHNLAGAYNLCTTIGGTEETKPGNTVGPLVQGLNTRMGKPSGPVGPPQYNGDYVDHTNEPTPNLKYNDATKQVTNSFGNKVIRTDTDLQTWFPGSSYQDYRNAYSSHPEWSNDKRYFERRMLNVPVANCTGSVNGRGSVDILSIGCFWLIQSVVQKGGEAQVFGEFVKGCNNYGSHSMDPNDAPGSAVTRIILYKDPDRIDS